MAPRTPLLRPDRYFRERRVSLLRGVAVVAAVTVALVAALYGVGYVMAANVDGTVLVDNPAYPGDGFCESPPPGEWGCDEPPQVERNVDDPLWDGVNEAVVGLFWVPVVGWLLTGTVLHAASWLAGGEGGPARTFAVAAWGMAPAVVSLTTGVALLAATFDPVTVTTGTDPAAAAAAVRESVGALETFGAVGGALTSLWTGVVWFFGLHHARDLPPGRAAAVAGGLTLLLLLGGS